MNKQVTCTPMDAKIILQDNQETRKIFFDCIENREKMDIFLKNTAIMSLHRCFRDNDETIIEIDLHGIWEVEIEKI